jgi:hypothetical protein
MRYLGMLDEEDSFQLFGLPGESQAKACPKSENIEKTDCSSVTPDAAHPCADVNGDHNEQQHDQVQAVYYVEIIFLLGKKCKKCSLEQR